MPPLRIFISYGRDQFAPLAARLAADLTAQGYEVWFDQQLQSGRPWARNIQKQLDWLVEMPQNGRFIYLLSIHSTREKSFCLSELQYAIDNQVPVFPILIENCKIPIEIYPLQRLDLRPCLPVEEHPAEYHRLLQTLVADMEGQLESRLANQKIIEDQISKQELTHHPVPNLNRSKIKRLGSPFRSRWVWVAIVLLVLIIIGVLSQNQVFMTSLRLSETPPPTRAQTQTVLPLSTLTVFTTAAVNITSAAMVTLTPTIAPPPNPTLIPPVCTSIGQTWNSPVDGMVLVCVPAGEFLMGSTDLDNDADANEKPQHTVYLDAYWIDQTEVTNAMYQKCVSAGKCKTRNAQGGDNFPQVNVDWTDAKTYCEWAGRQLPSEAQWEKAARGMDGRLYPWSNKSPNATLANYDLKVGASTSIGSYPSGASPYGALDMAGNVWEWVADWYSETYYQSQSTWRNPTGPAFGAFRSMRGGSWFDDDWQLRSAFRSFFGPVQFFISQGFRCCR